MATSPSPLRHLLPALGLILFIGGSPARAQNGMADQLGNGGGQSAQQACDYVLKQLDEWSEKHPAPKPPTDSRFNSDPRFAPGNQGNPGMPGERPFSPSDVEELATKYSTLGIRNLLTIEVAASEQYFGSLRGLLLKSLWRAIDTTVTDGDLTLFLGAASNHPGLLFYILKRPQWKDQEEVTTFIQSELDRASGGANGPSPMDSLLNFGPSNSKSSASRGITDDQYSNYLSTLIDAAKASGNPALAKKVGTVFENVDRSGDQYSYPVVWMLLQKAMDRESGYQKYAPGLLTSLVSDKNRRTLDEIRIHTMERVFSFLAEPGNGPLCADSRMQKAAQDLAKPVTHDENETFAAEAVCLMAIVGDRDNFQRSLRRYASDKRAHKNSMGNSFQFALMGTMTSPPLTDEKQQAIIDNADRCNFDTTTGRWTLNGLGF